MRRNARVVLSKWLAPLWPVTIVGIVVGALIGTFAFTASSDQTVVGVIRVDQPIDANQILSGTQPFPDAQPDYLAGEIVYLTSPGFLGTIQQNLKEADPPMVSATQNGKTNLITISATASTADEARRQVEAAVGTYTDHIKQQTGDRYGAALDAVNAIIPKLEDALRQTGTPPDKPTAELVQLYGQRTALQVQMDRAPGVQLVGPLIQSVSDAALPASSLGAIGGALVGGFIALAGALAWRNRSGTFTSPGQIEGLATPALLPVIRDDGQEVDASSARAIYAQLPPPRLGDILVIGASSGSGTGSVTRCLALAAEEHGKVDTIDLVSVGSLEGRTHAHTGPDDGQAHEEISTIIDGGTLENSPALIDAAEQANLIVVVVKLGLDTHASLGAAIQAIAERDVPVRVVCTKTPFLQFQRGGGGHRHEASAG